MLLWRIGFGGYGRAVRPRLHFHGYTSRERTGLALYGGSDLTALNRGEAKWLPISTTYARRLASSTDTGIRGLAVYHPNKTLLNFLGEVSAEYMYYYGPGTDIYGVPMFSIQFFHDG